MRLDDLPKESLIRIFGYLDLHDLIQKRLVSKKWCSVITNDVTYEELNIVDFFNAGKHRWYYTGQPLDFKYLLAEFDNDPLPDHLYKSKLFQTMFGQLKYLRLSSYLSETKGFHLDVLNCFQSLVHLDIFSLSVRSKKTLSLVNLKTLSISKFFVEGNDKSIVLTVCAKRLKNLNYGESLEWPPTDQP